MVRAHILELLMEVLACLRLSHYDESSSGTIKACEDVIVSLVKIIVHPQYLQSLCKKPAAHVLSLQEIPDTLFSKLGSTQTAYRRQCQKLLRSLINAGEEGRKIFAHAPNTLEWMKGKKGDMVRAVEGHDGGSRPLTNPKLRSSDVAGWLMQLDASLDSYIWMFHGFYANPTEVFASESSGSLLIPALSFFLDEIAFLPLGAGLALERKLDVSESKKFDLLRTCVVCHMIQFCALLSEQFPTFSFSERLNERSRGNLYSLILHSILSPRTLGFSTICPALITEDTDVEVPVPSQRKVGSVSQALERNLFQLIGPHSKLRHEVAFFSEFRASMVKLLTSEPYSQRKLLEGLKNREIVDYERRLDLFYGYSMLHHLKLLDSQFVTFAPSLVDAACELDARASPIYKDLAHRALELAILAQPQLVEVLFTKMAGLRGHLVYDMFSSTINRQILDDGRHLPHLMAVAKVDKEFVLRVIKGVLAPCRPLAPSGDPSSASGFLSCLRPYLAQFRSHPVQVGLVQLCNRMVLLDPEQLLDLSWPVLSIFEEVLQDAGLPTSVRLLPLESANAISLLPNSKSEPYFKVVKRTVLDMFPFVDSAPITEKGTEFLEQMLSIVEVSDCPDLLFNFVHLLRDSKSTIRKRILKSANVFFENSTERSCRRLFELCFGMLLSSQSSETMDTVPLETLRCAISDFCIPQLESIKAGHAAAREPAVEAFALHIKLLVDDLLLKADPKDQKSYSALALVQQRCAFDLVGCLYDVLPYALIKERINNQSFLIGKRENEAPPAKPNATPQELAKLEVRGPPRTTPLI